MPTPDEILMSLTVIANEWRWLAIAWHGAVVAMVIYALWRRPFQPTLAMLLTLPLVSVSVLAWWSGNPFNGIVFLALSVVMLLAASGLAQHPIAVGSRSDTAIGVLLLVFGLLYPHFADTDSWVSYLYASPFGLIPCPTLAVVTGISLIFDAFGSSRWAAGLTVALLAYGGVGVAVLGVWLDAVLLGGALTMAHWVQRDKRRTSEETRVLAAEL